jgi:hypothetical protein
VVVMKAILVAAGDKMVANEPNCSLG